MRPEFLLGPVGPEGGKLAPASSLRRKRGLFLVYFESPCRKLQGIFEMQGIINHIRSLTARFAFSSRP
jgi:hypothetical protein